MRSLTDVVWKKFSTGRATTACPAARFGAGKSDDGERADRGCGCGWEHGLQQHRTHGSFGGATPEHGCQDARIVTVLTAERLRELYSYDPETGLFAAVNPEATAFWQDHGYMRAMIDGKKYYAHRLAWLFVTGEWPLHVVDHEDLDGLNNRWRNIRNATRSDNQANRSITTGSKTGIKGVSLCRSTGRYRADIQVRGKRINLGRSDTIEGAKALYDAAAEKHFGKFARVA
jgi:hypothetical protein